MLVNIKNAPALNQMNDIFAKENISFIQSAENIINKSYTTDSFTDNNNSINKLLSENTKNIQKINSLYNYNAIDMLNTDTQLIKQSIKDSDKLLINPIKNYNSFIDNTYNYKNTKLFKNDDSHIYYSPKYNTDSNNTNGIKLKNDVYLEKTNEEKIDKEKINNIYYFYSTFSIVQILRKKSLEYNCDDYTEINTIDTINDIQKIKMLMKKIEIFSHDDDYKSINISVPNTIKINHSSLQKINSIYWIFTDKENNDIFKESSLEDYTQNIKDIIQKNIFDKKFILNTPFYVEKQDDIIIEYYINLGSILYKI